MHLTMRNLRLRLTSPKVKTRSQIIITIYNLINTKHYKTWETIADVMNKSRILNKLPTHLNV